MTSNADLARQLEAILALKVPPVGLVFSEAPIPGVPRIARPAPSGCSYWKLAAQGKVFYTIGTDHLGCAIGAYTHGAELTADARETLATTIGMMSEIGYLSESEIPQIPRRPSRLEVLTYGPLALLDREADVVLLRAAARAAMILAEASHAAGVGSKGAAVLRPSCAIVPDVLATRRVATSLGCIGNRVYTELPDDEVWWALHGGTLLQVLAHLATVAEANRKLEAFHRARA